MSNIYDDLTDDELLEFATPTVQNDTGVSFDDDLLFNSAKIDESDSIDTKTGAPCLLYTSPSPRDGLLSRMPSSA